jgi:hypothetical protein
MPNHDLVSKNIFIYGFTVYTIIVPIFLMVVGSAILGNIFRYYSKNGVDLVIAMILGLVGMISYFIFVACG